MTSSRRVVRAARSSVMCGVCTTTFNTYASAPTTEWSAAVRTRYGNELGVERRQGEPPARLRKCEHVGHRGGAVMKKAWTIFAVVSVLLIALQVTYATWREYSLEPLSEAIDLSRPGRYRFGVRAVHASSYHPEFRLRMPFVFSNVQHFEDADLKELWGGTPPRVHIRVEDSRGTVVLTDVSDLTRHDGWIATYGLGSNEVELYKFVEFKGRWFGSYRVVLEVLRGSPNAQAQAPRFEVATVKAYALLGVTLGLLLLIALIAIGASLLMFVSLVRRRRLPVS